MTSSRTQIAGLVAFAALASAGQASAKVYTEFTPRLSLLGGYDDNVQLNGSGADPFGRLQPGLRLDVFGEHQLHLGLDCQAGFAHLVHPERFNIASGSFATSEECGLGFRDHLSDRSSLHFQGVASYSQDPFAISGLGLLLRAGQTNVAHARLTTDYDYSTGTRGTLQLGAGAELLDFGANDPGNGALIAPFARYAHRTSPYDTFDLGAREQLFTAFGPTAPAGAARPGTSAGLVGESHALLLGWARRLSQETRVTIRGGPMLLTNTAVANAQTLQPAARLELETLGEVSGFHFSLSHDLLIGASRAGPTVADLAEASAFSEWGHRGELAHFTGHARAGIYRNADVSTPFTGGALGFDAEADVDWHFSREWSIGVAALRDARFGTYQNAVQVDRDVVQMRLTWEFAR